MYSALQFFNEFFVFPLQLSTELTKIHDELNQKMLEIKRLQKELQRRDNDEADEGVDILKKAVMDLQNENIVLKVAL